MRARQDTTGLEARKEATASLANRCRVYPMPGFLTIRYTDTMAVTPAVAREMVRTRNGSDTCKVLLSLRSFGVMAEGFCIFIFGDLVTL